MHVGLAVAVAVAGCWMGCVSCGICVCGRGVVVTSWVHVRALGVWALRGEWIWEWGFWINRRGRWCWTRLIAREDVAPIGVWVTGGFI